MSATEKMEQLLRSGQTVGTSLKWCMMLGTNQVPDIARKLKRKGLNIQTSYEPVKRNGRTIRVARYWL